MGTRLNAPNQFETLSPPWILANLDTNFVQNKAAWDDASFGFVNGVCVDTGVANAYVVTAGNVPFGAPTAYNPGMTIFINPVNSNTGASTIAVGALGTTAILNPGGNALVGGEIIAGKRLGLVYSNVAPVGMYIIGDCPVVTEATSATSITVNAAGCMHIVAIATFTATGQNVNLTNVPTGASIAVEIFNSSGSTGNFALTISNAAGTQVPANVIFSAGSSFPSNINTAASGSAVSIANTQGLILNGKMGKTQAIFSA